MVQKFYAIKSEKDINKGTIISTLFAIIVAGVILAECGLISFKSFEKPITADLTLYAVEVE